MILNKEYTLRRNKIIEKLDNNSLLILYGGVPKKFSADETLPFEINHNFYYLTGVKQESSVLLIKKNEDEINETLFILPYDPLVEKWTGRRITREEAKEVSGINNVLYTTQLEIEISSILSSGSIKNVYLDLDRELKIGESRTTNELKNELISKYSSLNIKDIYNDIIRLRMVKSEEEINLFKEAIKKTEHGLNVLMSNIHEGAYEFQMSALFSYTISSIDNSPLSFPTIVSVNKNATCLHYVDGKDELKNGDLILFDLGSRHELYCADISRTYPINGKFNKLQKKIYEIVLDCNKMIMKEAKEGITLRELNNLAKSFLAKECVKAKLISNEEEISNYYYHGVSHHIGLDTHDPAISIIEKTTNFYDSPLEEGNIISDEPGLYFKEYGIGIRIEDDILIGSKESINLSSSIIKEIKDIEKYMSLNNKYLK